MSAPLGRREWQVSLRTSHNMPANSATRAFSRPVLGNATLGVRARSGTIRGSCPGVHEGECAAADGTSGRRESAVADPGEARELVGPGRMPPVRAAGRKCWLPPAKVHRNGNVVPPTEHPLRVPPHRGRARGRTRPRAGHRGGKASAGPAPAPSPCRRSGWRRGLYVRAGAAAPPGAPRLAGMDR